MGAKRPEVGDERNTSFVPPEFMRNLTPGFHDEEPTSEAEGEYRFPRRRRQEDVPQESLAERIRKDRQGG
jgi:hypothetical protein